MTNQIGIKNGFVLIMTLVCMVVFSLLVLTMMRKLMFSSQVYEHLRTQHHVFYALESAGEHLFRNISVLKNHCTVSTSDLSYIDESWLHQKGCELSVSDEKYHYLFADIGEYPCLRIAAMPDKIGSHHWWIMVSSEHIRHTVLWMRIAVPEKQLFCHQKSGLQQIESRLSWYVQRA